MLIVSRKTGEHVRIDRAVEITVLETHGSQVKLVFSGPANVPVHRDEVCQRVRENVHHSYPESPVLESFWDGPPSS